MDHRKTELCPWIHNVQLQHHEPAAQTHVSQRKSHLLAAELNVGRWSLSDMMPALKAWDHQDNGSSGHLLLVHQHLADDGLTPALQPRPVKQLHAALYGLLVAVGIALACPAPFVASAPRAQKILLPFLAFGESHDLCGLAQATIGQTRLNDDDGAGVE